MLNCRFEVVFVMLSSPNCPVSLELRRSGALGADGVEQADDDAAEEGAAEEEAAEEGAEDETQEP
jgi:hypothetical protein